MKTAVLVIDMQRGLCDDPPRPHEAGEVVQRINALTERARAAGVPVAFIQHENDVDLEFDSERWQLADALHVDAGDTKIRKTTPDSFLRTPLEALLAGQGVQRVVICGYSSEFCVDTTARRAAALGFEVVLAADAHTSHDKPHATGAFIRAHHNTTLSDITSFGVPIRAVPSADIAF
ncbi:nicotinamidase-related amidase [Variovorax paradoxus]|jgi:nicotinamidase-related amidase|uniref:cysteine hydrolase family protein n=1 Tax=Variovorax paradoxus TaxID=34073 RepID=UPI00278B312C|nr:cysteine hydrolase family protein [Variovorax paradoxus]MDQ0023298.1 nicotinamidase-related amidase [Variovorax paradoxus]